MDAALAEKKEQLKHVEELLESEGYKILAAEIERQGKAGASTCCDVTLKRAERDAGAGKRTMADQLLAYLPQLRSSLEKTTSSRKR